MSDDMDTSNAIKRRMIEDDSLLAESTAQTVNLPLVERRPSQTSVHGSTTHVVEPNINSLSGLTVEIALHPAITALHLIKDRQDKCGVAVTTLASDQQNTVKHANEVIAELGVMISEMKRGEMSPNNLKLKCVLVRLHLNQKWI